MSLYYKRADFQRDYEAFCGLRGQVDDAELWGVAEKLLRRFYPSDDERFWKVDRFIRMLDLTSDCWTDLEIEGLLLPEMQFTPALIAGLTEAYGVPERQIDTYQGDLHQVIHFGRLSKIFRSEPSELGAVPVNFYRDDLADKAKAALLINWNRLLRDPVLAMCL